jgi:uncharacterized protein YkwD
MISASQDDQLPVKSHCSTFCVFHQTPGEPVAAPATMMHHRPLEADGRTPQRNSLASPVRDEARILPIPAAPAGTRRGVRPAAAAPLNPENTDRRSRKDALADQGARLHGKPDHPLTARRALSTLALCAMSSLLLCSSTVLANTIRAVNQARNSYCGLPRAGYPPLTANRKLNDVARLLAHGRSLGEAERRAGYRAARSLWIRITGDTDDASVAELVRRRFCGQLSDPHLRHIGTYRRGRGELWIVVAQPFTTPPQEDAAAASRRVLELTNRARARGRNCGWRRFPPAPPLSLSTALTRAAYAHSQDMATHNFFSHTGSDGSTPGERITRAGYPWSEVGENIASGVSTPHKLVADWLASPHHCANIMTAGFRQMGVAFAVNRESKNVIYWTEDFGTPR